MDNPKGKSIFDLSTFDSLNPKKGILKMYAAIKQDGNWDKFIKKELDDETLNKYVTTHIPQHELERMVKATQKQQRRAMARFDNRLKSQPGCLNNANKDLALAS